MSSVKKSARRRGGAALLEALVAVTILTISGIGMVTHVAQSVDSVRQMGQRDRATRAASDELHRALLWTQGEIAARAGRFRVTCCVMEVQPLSAVLYRVVLADTVTGVPLLETSIYARAIP